MSSRLKVLITGGAGYIGSILTSELLKTDTEVLVVDDFRYGTQSLNHLMNNQRLKIRNSDIREINKFEKDIKEADVIIPLAAIVGAPAVTKRALESRQINLDANLAILETKTPNQWVLMPTTNSAYGKGDAKGYCDEASELKPISNYAIEKVELETKLMQYENVVSLRLATVFGVSPRMRMDLLVNDFTWRAFRDKTINLFEGNYRRNYIHVKDVAKAMLHVLRNWDSMRDSIYNVGLSSANITKLELAERIRNFVPDLQILKVDNVVDPDQRDYLVSNAKIESTGFKCDNTLEDGISELLKYYSIIQQNLYGNI